MSGPTNTQFAVAVHALAYLAGEPGQAGPVSSDELALSIDVNPVHVRKVLGPLREAGVVASRPGQRGGWELVRDPAALTLAEVWDVVSGDGPVLGLHGPSPACPVGAGVRTVLQGLDRDVLGAVRRELAARTVADVAAAALPAASRPGVDAAARA